MRDALGLSGVVNRAGKASNARSRAGLLEDFQGRDGLLFNLLKKKLFIT